MMGLVTMVDDAWIWLLERRIDSHHGAGEQIQNEILHQLEHHCWSEKDIFAVRIALEEAVVNAIKHGNQLSRDKQVHVVCKISELRLLIQITDEGSGFKPEEVPDCTDDEHLCIPSGRGLLIMQSYMSRVEYNEAGNRVTLEKFRQE